MTEPFFMTGTNDLLLAGLERIGGELCSYMLPGNDWTKVRCDCKYGGPKPQGEQTGCPEVRQAHRLLSMLTDDEWRELAARTWTGKPDTSATDDPQGSSPKDSGPPPSQP